MNKFSISQLQQFSGIKAHTIRIWEQRYNALTPQRSEGNTRYYDNSQLRRLLNIVSLINDEHKASELCLMPDEKLFKLVDDQLKNSPGKDESAEYFISQLISAGLLYNEVQFDKIFSTCVLQNGIKKVYEEIIYPMLNRMGLMWQSNAIPPAQEHFISGIIMRKLSSAISSLPFPKSKSQDSWLLFLPENELHEIGLMFSHYLLKAAGKKVIYLGSNVPFQSLKGAVSAANPANLLFFFVHNDTPANGQAYLNNLQKNFDKANIYLSGKEELIKKLKISKRMHHLNSINELEEKLYKTGAAII